MVEVSDGLGLEASGILARAAEKWDKERMRRADKAASHESKTQRKFTALSKVQREDHLRQREGALYEAGAF